MLKTMFGYADHEARKLIRKGEGIYWNKTKNGEGKGNRSFCYGVLSDYIYADKLTKQSSTSLQSDKTSVTNSPQTLDNSHLVFCQNGISQNTKTNITTIDLTSENFEVIT